MKIYQKNSKMLIGFQLHQLLEYTVCLFTSVYYCMLFHQLQKA